MIFDFFSAGKWCSVSYPWPFAVLYITCIIFVFFLFPKIFSLCHPYMGP